MSKVLTIPCNLDEINRTKNKVDGFIIGIKNLSVNVNYYLDLNELEILNCIDKDIFISINKNMHNKDLKLIKELLIKLNEYNIKAVIYYDEAVLSIYNSLNLNYELCWAKEHSTTNYNTINYWYKKGAKYSYISSDITEEEVEEIVKNSKSKLLLNLFGYLPMFVSKRHIVKNYLEYFNLKDSSRINYIEKENKKYPIIDNEIGTQVYSNNILNGIKSIFRLNVEYIVLNSFNIELNKFIEIIDLFKTVTKDKVEEYSNKINNMFSNVDYGFLNTKTIYKVK